MTARKTSSLGCALAVVALHAAVSSGAALAECGQAGVAAPDLAEFSQVTAGTYLSAIRQDATVADKTAAADTAISRAQGNLLIVVGSVVADQVARSTEGLQTENFKKSSELARAMAARMNEVGRTDKQVGAAATVSGSTSAATKTDLPYILSLAIENGAVEREDNGTSATLSTTPYALLLLGEEDTDATFNRYAHLRRLGVAATLDLAQSDSKGSGNFSADQVSAVSTTVRLFGDRSARTTAFTSEWQTAVEPLLLQQAQALQASAVEVVRHSPEVLQIVVRGMASGPKEGVLRKHLRQALLDSSSKDDAVAKVQEALLAYLCSNIVEPLDAGKIQLSGLDRGALVGSAALRVESLKKALDAQQLLLDELNSAPVVTLQHTWNRAQVGSDFSNFALAADGMVGARDSASTALDLLPLSVLLNASLAVNHDPNEALKQETVREYGLSASLEKSMKNPIRLGNEEDGASRISLSLTGRYARLKDVNDDIGIVHGRIAVPLVRGFSFVVALNYATRTETETKSEVRLAGGLEFNADTFGSLAELQSLFAQQRQ